jgi:hypothetical protein
MDLDVIAPTTYMAYSKSYNATFCVIFSSLLLNPPIGTTVLHSAAFTDSLSTPAMCVSRLDLRHQLLSVLLWLTRAWQ